MLRPDTIKLLEENIGRTLYDINHSKILSHPSPREMEIKTKITKWDLMKLKSFCTAKETINKTKRQPSEWEKIFANDTTDKGFKYIFDYCFCSISLGPSLETLINCMLMLLFIFSPLLYHIFLFPSTYEIL